MDLSEENNAFEVLRSELKVLVFLLAILYLFCLFDHNSRTVKMFKQRALVYNLNLCIKLVTILSS